LCGKAGDLGMKTLTRLHRLLQKNAESDCAFFGIGHIFHQAMMISLALLTVIRTPKAEPILIRVTIPVTRLTALARYSRR
jgi:hypothetical protein